MNKCRLRGEFDCIKYTGENREEVLQVLRDNGYAEARIGNYNLLMYCKFDYNSKTILEPISIVDENDYLVILEHGKVEKYPENIFELSFTDV